MVLPREAPRPQDGAGSGSDQSNRGWGQPLSRPERPCLTRSGPVPKIRSVALDHPLRGLLSRAGLKRLITLNLPALLVPSLAVTYISLAAPLARRDRLVVLLGLSGLHAALLTGSSLVRRL